MIVAIAGEILRMGLTWILWKWMNLSQNVKG